VWEFVKNPEYQKYNLEHRSPRQIFLSLLKWQFVFSIGLALCTSLIIILLGFEFYKQSNEKMFEGFTILELIMVAVILAPVVEEFVFRWPLKYFQSPRFFKYAFYTSVILFGLAHISNFSFTDSNFWFSPILVTPQLAGGIFLGFIRVKLNVFWSILLHSTFNAIAICPFILSKLLMH
jgi:hypothetical protein